MSVNNNATVSADNPFFDQTGLEHAGLEQNEQAVLSNCDYTNFTKNWKNGLGNISDTRNIHKRNAREVKEGIFRQLGAAMGFCSFDPWKETKQLFSDWRSFDSYVRMKIAPETYQKIAKANPRYFDKVIKHLESIADDLDKRADVRLGTFVSHQSGETLAMLANDFRSTAAFLRLKMKGDDAAKPGNNNANPGSNQGQPTVINHYHNNIGHIGDINIGHLGDNNFHNKGGNMGVMFKEGSNGVPHTGFKSEYSVSKTEHSFYSPTINGRKLLDITAGNALKLLGSGDKDEDKGKQFKVQRNGNLEFEAQEPLPKEEPKNFEKQQVNSINLGSEEPQQLYETKKDLKTYYKKEEPAELQQSRAPKEAENINSVQPKQTAIENCSSKLRKLRTMFFANWDAINKDLKNGDNTKSGDTDNFKNKVQFFNKSAGNFGNEITPEKVVHDLQELENDLNKTVEKQNKVDGDHWSSLEPLLSGIELMLSKDKTTAEKEIKDKREKSENLSVDKQEHGIGFSKDITEEEKKNAQDLYQKQNYSANRLLQETLETIEYIREQAGLKKITNPPTNKTKSQPKPRPDVKEINQETNQPSAFERRQQFGMKIEEKNKNLKKRADKQEKLHEPSARERREAYQNDTVDLKNANMKKDPFDRNAHKWIPNDGSKMQRTADNANYKTFNANVTDPSFHRHDSQ